MSYTPMASRAITPRTYAHQAFQMRQGIQLPFEQSSSPLSKSSTSAAMSSASIMSSPAAYHEALLAALPAENREDYIAHMLAPLSDRDLSIELGRRMADQMKKRKDAADTLVHLHDLPVIQPGSTPPPSSSSSSSDKRENINGLSATTIHGEAMPLFPSHHGHVQAWEGHKYTNDSIPQIPAQRVRQTPVSPLVPSATAGVRRAAPGQKKLGHHEQQYNAQLSRMIDSHAKLKDSAQRNASDSQGISAAPNLVRPSYHQSPERALSPGFGRPLPPIPTDMNIGVGHRNFKHGNDQLVTAPPTPRHVSPTCSHAASRVRSNSIAANRSASATTPQGPRLPGPRQRQVGRTYYQKDFETQAGTMRAIVSVDEHGVTPEAIMTEAQDGR